MSFLILFTLNRAVEEAPSQPRLTVYSGMEYALQHEEIVLYITESGENAPWFSPGGFLSTKTRRIFHEDLEANCAGYLNQYSAVLSLGHSECLIQNKHRASYFIEDGGLIFFRH